MIHSSGGSQAIKSRVEPHFPARNAVIIAKTIGDHDTQTFFGRAESGTAAPRRAASNGGRVPSRPAETCVRSRLPRSSAPRTPPVSKIRRSAPDRGSADVHRLFESAIVRSASADRKPLERRSFSIRLSQMPADIPTHAPSPTRWHSTPIHRPPLAVSGHRPDLDCAVR